MSIYSYEEEAEEEAELQMKKMAEEAADKHRLAVGTFGTEIGLRYLESLEAKYVNVPIYTKNSKIEDVSYKQAKADLIKDIRKELSNG